MSTTRKTPKLRFPEFTDDWEQRKLKEITSRVQGNDGRVNLQTLTISAGNGWMKQEDRFSANIAGKEQKNYTLLKKGELAYNHGNSKLAKFGAVFELKDFDEALVPRVYHSFRVNNKTNSSFIEYMFATKLPDKELGKLVSSGARMDGLLNIGYEDFVGINITVPSLEEQQKIAYHFRKLDEVITLHQRELDSLKKLKKSLLQKMFPKNGEKIPELRFPEFTGDWEQRKFSDVVEIGSGKDYKNLGLGDIPVYGTGGYMLSVDQSLSKDRDAIGIGRKGTIDKPFIIRAPFWTVDTLFYCIPKNKQNLQFTYCLFQNVDWKTYDESTGVPSLSKSTINNVTTKLPNLEEQQKIGELFNKLDTTITLHQRELDTLKKLKKGLLQNMFV